ncbi:DUF3307 domain-containing protein [candidate division KSB1 bacterium]|nr:DUF3307 domain-containing protein [candidate division KSB1 bacterium]
MLERLVVVLVTAHVLSDYLFQGPAMVAGKKALRWRWYFLHTGSYFVAALLLALNWRSWSLLFAVLIQSVLHGLVDYVKVRLESRHPHYKLEWDGIDLFLHLFVIWVTVMLLRPVYTPVVLPESWQFLQTPLSDFRVYVYLAAVVFLCRGGTCFVRDVLEKVRNGKPFVQEDNTGRLIGNIERILIFLLIIYNSLAAIGFVLAAKSIARFEELKDKRFAEYYLIGTLSSALLAMVVGWLAVYVIRVLHI